MKSEIKYNHPLLPVELGWRKMLELYLNRLYEFVLVTLILSLVFGIVVIPFILEGKLLFFGYLICSFLTLIFFKAGMSLWNRQKDVKTLKEPDKKTTSSLEKGKSKKQRPIVFFREKKRIILTNPLVILEGIVTGLTIVIFQILITKINFNDSVEIIETPWLLTLAIFGLLTVIFYFLIRKYSRKKNALESELRRKDETSRLMLVEMLKDHEVETLNAMLDGQEQERKRISRDLHDSLGSLLAAVQITLASLQRKLPNMSEVAKQTYDKAETLLDQAYSLMRNISHDLADLTLKEGGLSPALGQLEETLSENTNIDIHMNYKSLGGRRLDSNVEQHSFRITQELFLNVIKHAEASQIKYELNFSPNKLQISIKDDGKGFGYDTVNKVPGIGLNNILTRVSQLDGKLDVMTKPGEGTHIKIDIPLLLS